MENETTVEMNAPEIVVDAQVADAPDAGGEAQEEVRAVDLYDDDVPKETVESPAADEQPSRISSQKDFDAALGKRLQSENAKGYNRAKSELEASPEMRLVRDLIEDRARDKGITREQALQELQNERIRARSEAYVKNPAQFYEDIMLGRTPTFQAQQPTTTPQGYMSPEEMGRQMADALRSGEVPDGFDFHNIDPQFFSDANKYGVSAALRVWKAEHAGEVQAQANAKSIADELQRRQKAPKPMSPTSANPSSPAPPNYSTMSSEQFKKIEAQVRKAALEGKLVRLD